MSKLVPTNRIDYRYYMWIRRMWGLTSAPKPKSLCPYFHTMLWGSILCVACAPFFPVGWVFMKIFRIFCKIEVPIIEGYINFVDEKTEWLTRLDNGPNKFAESPILTGVIYTLFGITILSITVACIGMIALLFGVAGLGLWNIVDLVVWVFDSIAWIFAQAFAVFWGPGWVFHRIYTGAIWLFTNGPLWTIIGTWAGWIIAWLIVVGFTAIALCFACIGISKMSISKRFANFIGNKLNGYSEAQKARRERVKEAVKKLPKWKCENCGYDSNLDNLRSCDHCNIPRRYSQTDGLRWCPWYEAPWYLIPFIPILWVIEKIVAFCTKVKIRENVIGPLGTIWEYIIALKKGVCPLLEFVDPKEIQARQQASAKKRMDRENKCD